MVALALPHTPETAGLLSRARLERMKPGAVLLNAGRGSAVDCAALAELLTQGRLLGAGMDVTDPEPLPPEHPLWDTPGALITPHTAGGYNHMELTLERIRALFLDNLRRYTASPCATACADWPGPASTASFPRLWYILLQRRICHATDDSRAAAADPAAPVGRRR